MFQPILIRRSVSYLNLSSISMRLISQLLRLDSFAVSTKSNEKQFRRALIHCAAVLFVLICCICAVFVYYIFEPFLHCILWALLLDTLLFPLKNHSTIWARSFLEQSRVKQHFLWYDVCFLLPCRIIDRTFESISSICRHRWKECLFITLFRPTAESMDFEVFQQYLTTIDFHPLTFCQTEWKMFNNIYWMPILIFYLFGVLTYSKRSRLIQISLSFMTGSVWLILFIYVSQYSRRLIDWWLLVCWLSFSLLVLSVIDESGKNRNTRVRHLLFKCRLGSIEKLCILELTHTHGQERKISIITHFANFIRVIRVNRDVRRCSVSPSAPSIPYFRHLLCIFIAMKFDNAGIYLIVIVTMSFIYKWIKSIFLTLYAYGTRQQLINGRAIEFMAAR